MRKVRTPNEEERMPAKLQQTEEPQRPLWAYPPLHRARPLSRQRLPIYPNVLQHFQQRYLGKVHCDQNRTSGVRSRAEV